jgi:hypothetical protein
MRSFSANHEFQTKLKMLSLTGQGEPKSTGPSFDGRLAREVALPTE